MIQSKADRTRRNRTKEGFLVGGTQGFCNRSVDQASRDLEEGQSRNGVTGIYCTTRKLTSSSGESAVGL